MSFSSGPVSSALAFTVTQQQQSATIEGSNLIFVVSNDGQWPRSWEDLARIRPDGDFDGVADHVKYEFDANPALIATQTPDTFTAIQPHLPCYVHDMVIQEPFRSYSGKTKIEFKLLRRPMQRDARLLARSLDNRSQFVDRIHINPRV